MSMKHQVMNVVKCANYHLRNISRIRKYLTTESAKQVVVSLVLSRIDYCNALLFGVSSGLVHQLQLVQNTAAKLIFRKKKFDHVTPLLVSLHWLPVDKRIIFKILLLVYKCLHNMAPIYLKNLIRIKQNNRTLRSSYDTTRLKEGKARLINYGDRAFYIYAPKLWNNLPIEIRKSKSLELFKRHLKTHLFKTSYSSANSAP